MVRPRAELGSLRFSRLEKERLIVALLFSLFAHLGVWGGYEAGKKAGLWEKLHWPILQKQVQPPPPVVQNPEPSMFVDVSQAAADAPKEAKYYSDKNSRAANPDADKDSNQPKLNGKQKEVPKTETVTRPVKSNPAPPKPTQSPSEPKPAEPQTVAAQNRGDTEKNKPTDTLHPDPKPPTPERPRTLQQARASQPSQMAGREMQQDGGVRHHNPKASLAAIQTPFGDYDRAIIEAVQQRWDDLLYAQNFAFDRAGKVTVSFHLNPDGSVTESKVVSTTVGDLLAYYCQEAIAQAAPFGSWPSDMRRIIGTNFREMTFTFYYY